MNIFDVIKNVTNRIEPFHSEFLCSVLENDQTFRNLFLTQILPENWRREFISSSNHGNLKAISEDVLPNNKRIDIVVKDKLKKQIIGIEVKTTDSSVTENQLSVYLEGMQKKYAGYDIFIVYLTPYNRANIPDSVLPEQIPSIREFDKFNTHYTKAVHINWKNIVELYPNDNLNSFLYAQHRKYIAEKITDSSSLINRIESIEKNRGFSEFIGANTFEMFIDDLQKEKIVLHENDKEFKIFLNENTGKFTRLIKIIELLFSSENFNKTVTKKNEIDQSLIDSYESSEFKEFFIMLFSAVQEYPYLWFKGKNRLGLRAPHSSHKSSGVSLLTIDFDSIKIIKER